MLQDAEVGNALVSKNFAFQFFNNVRHPQCPMTVDFVAEVQRLGMVFSFGPNGTNPPCRPAALRLNRNWLFQYYVLFYIAYMRELKDPISGTAHPCAGGNCLPELQYQLMVVFTGKTIGKQIAFTLKPFVFKWLNSLKDNKLTSKFVKAASAVTPKALSDVAGKLGMTDQFGDAQSEAKKAKDPFDKQSHLMPYLGTFDDFNDRVIQFGYLVLFAPAYPLAPFLAFINNVIELRTSGFKYCRGFQRPVWQPKDSIGSWLGVMNLLGFLAVREQPLTARPLLVHMD